MIEILVIIIAIILDFALGEPHRKIHPTVWMGSVISRLVVIAKKSTNHEQVKGIIITLTVAALAIIPILALYAITFTLESDMQAIIIIISSILVLYATISIRSMLQHVNFILKPLESDDINLAQQRLATVVKRDTGKLDKPHIFSGLVETIAENTVDGIIGPLFFFTISGAPGALVYRAVNTIDAMIGYKTQEFKDLGWFGANCDKILNYIPARTTGILIIISAAILGLDWRGALYILRTEHEKLASPNAGYPIAAMSGALGVYLEKIGHYKINSLGKEPTVHDVNQAKRIMLVCVGLYVALYIGLYAMLYLATYVAFYVAFYVAPYVAISSTSIIELGVPLWWLLV